MTKENGGKLRVELLRSLDWLTFHSAAIGNSIHLDLPEMGAEGPATVTFVGPCPKILPGPGNVVTGRFIHESADNLINLLLEGDSKPTGVTDGCRRVIPAQAAAFLTVF